MELSDTRDWNFYKIVLDCVKKSIEYNYVVVSLFLKFQLIVDRVAPLTRDVILSKVVSSSHTKTIKFFSFLFVMPIMISMLIVGINSKKKEEEEVQDHKKGFPTWPIFCFRL